MRSPAYVSWNCMKQRCNNPKRRTDNAYKGITYCDRWEKFINFYEDMGDRPAGTTLDRIDPNGNYTKENCRWANITIQNNNKRNNVKYNYDGELLTLRQLSIKYNIDYIKLKHRIYRNKESIEKAMLSCFNKKGA